jgi:DNA-binding NtrC family response regulator
MMLTDVVMPGQSGPILAQRVLQIRPNIKVLYMSGYTGDKMAQYGSSDADVAFLPKPFNPQRLLQKVRAVLDS